MTINDLDLKQSAKDLEKYIPKLKRAHRRALLGFLSKLYNWEKHQTETGFKRPGAIKFK